MKPTKSLFQDLILPLKGLNQTLLNHYKTLAQKNHLDQTIKQVFLKNSEERTFEEIYLIKEFLVGFSYFQKIQNNYGQDCLFRISQFSQLSYIADGTTIIKKTEEPNSIHFILEGQVMQITENVCKVSNIADAIFEENIITNIINKSDFICKKNSTFIIINGFIFRATLHKYQKQFHIKNTMLLDQEIFSILEEYDQNDMLSSTQQLHFLQHQRIFNLNDPVDYIYIVLEGELLISQKVGYSQKNTFSKNCNQFMADFIKEKPKLNTLARITKNDFFGFDEYLDSKQFREQQVECESKNCKVARIPLNIFFQKYNQFFNQKEFQQLLQVAQERKEYRKRIYSLQIQLFTERNLNTKLSNSRQMYYETIEQMPYDNQIRSRPRSFMLKDKILVPDDYVKNSQFSVRLNQIRKTENRSIDQDVMTVESSSENAKKQSKKKKIQLNYQIEKKLHENKSFNKIQLVIKEDYRSLSPTRIEPLANMKHFKTEQRYDHIQLKKEFLQGSQDQYKNIREQQNSKFTPTHLIPQFKPKQRKFLQKLIIINKKEKPLLEII